MARPAWLVLLVGWLFVLPEHGECADPGPTDVPIGFGVTSDELMKQKDAVIAYFTMGLVKGHFNSLVLGSDPASIEHLVRCSQGRPPNPSPPRFAAR